MDVIPALVRVFVGAFVAAPLPTLLALWWVIGLGLGRVATALGLPKWVVYLGPGVGVWWLWKRRQGRAAVAVVVGFWLLILWAFPETRFAFGVAAPAAMVVGGLLWLWSDYPQLPPLTALRCAVAERRHREVLVDAVPASAGEGARVLSVKKLGEGEFEAQIVGPAGTSHADLMAALRDTLAESVLSQSGQRLAHVAVVGAGAKGAVRVRCSTEDPYRKTMSLDEVRDK